MFRQRCGDFITVFGELLKSTGGEISRRNFKPWNIKLMGNKIKYFIPFVPMPRVSVNVWSLADHINKLDDISDVQKQEFIKNHITRINVPVSRDQHARLYNNFYVGGELFDKNLPSKSEFYVTAAIFVRYSSAITMIASCEDIIYKFTGFHNGFSNFIIFMATTPEMAVFTLVYMTAATTYTVINKHRCIDNQIFDLDRTVNITRANNSASQLIKHVKK